VGSFLTVLLLNTQVFCDVTQAFPNIQGQTVLNCLILKIKTLHFFKMSELSCPMTQCPRTISPNDSVTLSPSHPMAVSQNYLTQWHSVPELSHPMTVSQNYLAQWHSAPELSRPMTVPQNYLTQWHSVPELSQPMTQCPRTISTNDTVSQNYLTQWHSVTLP